MRVEMMVLYPPRDEESPEAWTNRVLSHSREHEVNRQCSIGWHAECSDPDGESCQCICHAEDANLYSVEGHAESGELEVTRVKKGKHFWPPVDGEPESMWAWWVWAVSKKDAKKRAVAKQEKVLEG
jgi:hypothetical protein